MDISSKGEPSQEVDFHLNTKFQHLTMHLKVALVRLPHINEVPQNLLIRV